MEQWVRARLEEARFTMLTQLEDNIAQVADTAQGAFGLAALRIARMSWKDLLDGVPTAPQADPSACPVDEYQHMVSMNVSLRSQLKEANAIARNVYKIILGPPNSTTRTVDTIFKNLEDGVRQLQKDMFVLQHANDDPTQFDCVSFSIKDYLQLAEFKMSHAAKRIFEVETNAAGTDGSGIDWEFRMQELTRDLQAQLLRTTRALESEKVTHAEAIRVLRCEIDDIKKRHGEDLSRVNAAHDKFLKELKSAFAADMRDLGESLVHRVQDIQITFVHKLGEFRDLDSESKAASIRALQQVLAVERSRVEDRVNYFADADKALERNADRYVGDVAVYDDHTDDAHSPWDGESAETLIRILKGKRAEMELQQQSFNVQNRMRNMEWETNLRDIMRQYEEEIGRMREKMKHLEAEAEHAAKLVTIRMQETAEARAEMQRAQRQKQEELARLRAANEKEVAGLNQDIAAVDTKLQKANETISAQERQISDAHRKNDQLLDEIDSINATVLALKEAMESMKPVVDMVDVEVQTQGKRHPDHEDFRTKHAQHTVAALGRIVRGRSSAASNGSETDTRDRLQDVVVGNRTALSRDGTPLVTPAPPATVHSRRDSLAFQYLKRDAMLKKHTLDSAAPSGQTDEEQDGTPPPDGTLVPTEQGFCMIVEALPVVFKPRTDLLPDLVRCKECGCTIAEHEPTATRGVPPVVNLGDVPCIAAYHLSSVFPFHRLFNARSSEKTDKVDSKRKDEMRRAIAGGQSPPVCVVCSKPNPSLAHLLKNRNLCEKAGTNWDDASNFILLCGSLGEEGTCHDAFASFRVSFRHVSGKDNSHWYVFGGPYHGREVVIASRPHRRVMHAHLTHCIIKQSLDPLPDDLQRDLAVDKLSNSPEQASDGVPSNDS